MRSASDSFTIVAHHVIGFSHITIMLTITLAAILLFVSSTSAAVAPRASPASFVESTSTTCAYNCPDTDLVGNTLGLSRLYGARIECVYQTDDSEDGSDWLTCAFKRVSARSVCLFVSSRFLLLSSFDSTPFLRFILVSYVFQNG